MSTLATGQSALLVMDMQNALVDRMAATDLFGPIRDAVRHARSSGLPVIFVRVAFREGHPEVVRSNPTFAAAVEHDLYLEGSDDAQLHPEVGRQSRDPLVTKRRVSAFAGSDLPEILRAHGATELVLCGIATSGVVLSTARQASDLDYQVTILRDACKDAEQDLHDFLMDRVLPRSGKVTTVAEWTTSR